MIMRLVRALLILPGTVLVIVPALILWLTHGTSSDVSLGASDDLSLWLGLLSFGLGLAFAVWTFMLFVGEGEGTPAPWDPPQKLVVRGPYRYVRNPMITGVLFVLAGEALFFGSWALGAWLLLFFFANAIYFPLREEKALETRFGDAYQIYKANVPRWIPRVTPWRQR